MKLQNNLQPKFVPDLDLCTVRRILWTSCGKPMDQVRQVLRYHHYAYRTEQAYCNWIVRFIKYHGCKTHPGKMGKQELCTAPCGESYLSHLATHQKISVAKQRQAMHALIFLYQRVLDKPVEGKIEPVNAKKRKALPVVMTK